MKDVIRIKAKLTLYPTEKGGKSWGIKTGYRPNHIFEYPNNSTDLLTTYIGQIEFAKELILPSETENVIVLFLKHPNIIKYIEVGRIWWIHEGIRKVGEGKIIEVNNPV